MKTSILITSALASAVLALPQPQLLDLDLNARLTLFVTVTVTETKAASTCLPTSVIVLPSVKPSPSIPGLPPVLTAAPGQLSTTKRLPLPLPQTTSRSVPVVVLPTSRTLPVTLSTSRPPVVPPVGQSSSRPASSAIASPTPQVPSPGGHVPGTDQAFLSVGLAYQASILFHHNAARANHGASPLTWDASCEANARITANTCNFAHSFPAGVVQGQNLYITSGSAFNVTAAITESWYKSELPAMNPYFGFPILPITVFASVGHLTQVVWKGTTKVGCASVDCGTRMKVNGAASNANKYTVCNYASAGNLGGLFALNVGRPLSTTKLGKWTD